MIDDIFPSGDVDHSLMRNTIIGVFAKTND